MRGTISTGRAEKIGSFWPLLCLAAAGSAWLSVRFGQDISWDLRNYHYYAGFAFLHKPLDYDFAPAQVQTFFNPLQHVLTYFLLTSLPSKAVAVILGGIQGLNFYLIFQISRHLLWGRLPNWLCTLVSLGNAAAGFYGTANIIELGTTMGDNLYSILVLTAILLILRYLTPERYGYRRKPAALLATGCLLGFAFALKLTAIMYVSAIGFILTALLPLVGVRIRAIVILYAGLGVGFVAGYGFWGAHLYRQYKNPVYPYLNNIFHSPYYDLNNTMDARFKPRNRAETFFYPFFFTVENGLINEMPFREIRFALCYIAVIGIVLVLLYRPFRLARGGIAGHDLIGLVFLTAVFGISYFVWEALFSILRYLIVLEMLAPSFLALAAAVFLRRSWAVIGFSLAVNAAIVLAVIPTDFGRQQKFENDFLQIHVPLIPGIDRSLVLMAGDDPTGYIAAQFPSTTRFAKLYSNYYFPGRNVLLDGITRGIVSRYDAAHILAYVSESPQLELMRDTLRFYGLKLVEQRRYDLGRKGRTDGYLYHVTAEPKMAEQVTARAAQTVVPDKLAAKPVFLRSASVALTVDPGEGTAGVTLTYTVTGLKTTAIDMMYEIDGKKMPPIREWKLDRGRQTVFISKVTAKGHYRITAIRDSFDPRPNTWYLVDVKVLIQ
jgi:hypothetical protein